jgi:hypothetical protein
MPGLAVALFFAFFPIIAAFFVTGFVWRLAQDVLE